MHLDAALLLATAHQVDRECDIGNRAGLPQARLQQRMECRVVGAEGFILRARIAA